MKVQAICTDIDGTLLNRERQLSRRTIETIRKVSDIPVILASSRMPSAMRHLQQELGIMHHPLICYNGGYVLHYADSSPVPEVVSANGIGPDIAASVLQLARGTQIHTSIYHEDQWHAPALDHWTDREQTITKVNATVSDIAAVLDSWTKQGRKAHKIMCMGPENEIKIMEHQLNRAFSADLHVYRSRATYLELAARKISKATALKLVLDRIGIPLSAAMAFGDNYNDIEMLQSVGMGIAVSNARDEVKSIAHQVTAESVNDGVAISIEQHCL